MSNLIFKKKIELLNIMLIYTVHKNNHILDNTITNFLKLIDNDNITIKHVIGDFLAYLLYVLHDNRYYTHLKYIYYNILLHIYTISLRVIEYLNNNNRFEIKTKVRIYDNTSTNANNNTNCTSTNSTNSNDNNDDTHLSKQCSQIYALETFAYLTINLFVNKCMYVLNNLSIQFLNMFILSLQLVDNYINDL
ncbi:hypothetical protein HEP_00529200, partial [Hepatocystis sp. ex Piliocolobus tephrosceles]